MILQKLSEKMAKSQELWHLSQAKVSQKCSKLPGQPPHTSKSRLRDPNTPSVELVSLTREFLLVRELTDADLTLSSCQSLI